MGCKQPLLPTGHPHTPVLTALRSMCQTCLTNHTCEGEAPAPNSRVRQAFGKTQPAMDLTPALTLPAACSAFSQGDACWGCWALKSSGWSKTEINGGLRNTTNPSLSLQHPSLFLISSDPSSRLYVGAVRSGKSFAPCCLDQCCQKACLH